MELHYIIAIQKIIFSASIFLTIATAILFILNIYMSEKVKVNLSKQVKKEKITFDDITLPNLDKKSDSNNKSDFITTDFINKIKTEEKQDFSQKTFSSEKTSTTKSIFDLKDL